MADEHYKLRKQPTLKLWNMKSSTPGIDDRYLERGWAARNRRNWREPDLRNVFQQFPQQRSIAFSKRHTQSIVQLHEHIAIRGQMELLDVVEIDDGISMHP